MKMARTVKRPEERRVEFLLTAQKLFIQNGYYATSVDHIVKAMGVAKGLFYYYFKSKEDLVSQMVDHLWDGAVEDYERIRDMEDLNALEKMMLFSSVRGEVKLQQTYLVEVLVKEPHSPLVQQLRDRGYSMLTPIMGEIITQGVKEGFFDTDYPHEAAAFLIRGAEGLITEDLGDADAVIRSFTITLDVWERVLGAKKGTFKGLLERHEDLMRTFAEAADRIERTDENTDVEGDD
jgi:AcrR family transcriptional regulator